jgi:dGTPase
MFWLHLDGGVKMDIILQNKIKQELKLREDEYFSRYAAFSSKSKGRVREETPSSEFSTEYQKDIERIVHSKAFRRLKGKAQVFISPKSDHCRTRLTHTLEVSQISKTIARALKLNEDLAEAISLGHDLGHPPFGHKGEALLNKICPLGFKHNEHSLRIIDVLECKGGLNLTYEVRDGILCHTTGAKEPDTLEAMIVRFADKIAYVNHDVDDAMRAKLMNFKDIPENTVRILGKTSQERIDTLISSVIENSFDKPEIKMGEEIYEAMMELRKFLLDNIYSKWETKEGVKRNHDVIYSLYTYYTQNSDDIPHGSYVLSNSDNLDQIVCDYIAGMTDNYAISQYERICEEEEY